MMIMKSEFHDKDDKDDKDDKYKKHQQTNNIDSKPSNIFNYLKSLSPEASDLMDEIEDDDDIAINKLAFIGSNKEKFNFNTLRMSLNLLSDIYNGKISLNEAEFKQKDLEIEIENLQLYCIPKTKEEKEEKSQVLMQANDLLESRNKVIKAFKVDILLSEHLKKIRCCCL